jgi:hypothetical protein
MDLSDIILPMQKFINNPYKIKKFLQSQSLLKYILVIVSIIITLLVCEFISNILFKNNTGIFPRYVTNAQYGDFRIRRNIPYAHYWHKSSDGQWDFTINSQGFRDKREFDYQKPPGVIRVLVLGDSFTIGFEVNQEETYAAVIERYLKQNDINAEVINAGMSGNSNAEELIFFEQEGWKYQPDIVVLGYYGNDLDDNIKSDLYRLVSCELTLNKREYLPAIKISDFLNSSGVYRWLSENSYFLNLIINAVTEFSKQRLAKDNIAGINIEEAGELGAPITTQDYKEMLSIALVKRIYILAQANHAFFILLDIPDRELEPSVPQNDNCHPGRLADAYIDSSALLKKYRGITDLYQPHGQHHWTKFSHLIAGEEVGKTILELLKR